ncbi:MAG TPA: hypothetical protein VIG48_06100 [Jatrophihabitans sp.]
MSRVLIVLASAGALWGWIAQEHSTDVLWSGTGVYALAYGLFGAALCALRIAQTPDGLRAGARVVRTRQSSRDTKEQFAALDWPRMRDVWVPLLLIPFMALTLPVAFHTSPGDWSILGVLAGCALVVGPVCVLLGVLAWVFVMLSTIWLARFTAPAIRAARDSTRGTWSRLP